MLDEVEAFYQSAFHDLGTERQYGMTVGPIPHSRAQEYAADLGIHGDEFDFFWSVIRRLDGESARIANASAKIQDTEDDSDKAGKRVRMKAKPLKKK